MSEYIYIYMCVCIYIYIENILSDGMSKKMCQGQGVGSLFDFDHHVETRVYEDVDDIGRVDGLAQK